MHPISGFSEFPAKANQTFHPLGVGGLVPVSSGKDKILTYDRRMLAVASHGMYRPTAHSNCLHNIM